LNNYSFQNFVSIVFLINPVSKLFVESHSRKTILEFPKHRYCIDHQYQIGLSFNQSTKVL